MTPLMGAGLAICLLCGLLVLRVLTGHLVLHRGVPLGQPALHFLGLLRQPLVVLALLLLAARLRLQELAPKVLPLAHQRPVRLLQPHPQRC